MNRVRNKAAVSPSTLTKMSKGWEPLKRPRKTGSKNPVTVTRVDPRVWTVARKLANKNNRRIEVVSYTEVIVHNNSNWRK